MANKSYYVYDKENDEFIPIKLIDAGDGTYRMAVQIEGASFGDVNVGDVEIVLLPLDTFAADAQAYGKGVLIQGDDGTDRRAVLVDTDGHPQVDVLSSVVEKVIKAFSFTPVVHFGDSIASKSLIADKITLTDAVRSSGGGGRIKTITIGDLAYQKDPMDLVFFNADPDSTVWTKDLMFDIDDADLPKIIGIVNIEGTDWASFKDNSAVCKQVDIAFNAVGSADIFVALIARYTTTYTTASDLNVHVVIEQD